MQQPNHGMIHVSQRDSRNIAAKSNWNESKIVPTCWSQDTDTCDSFLFVVSKLTSLIVLVVNEFLNF